MRLGILYFGLASSSPGRQEFERVLNEVTVADEEGLEFVMFPERHFNKFGGNYPNPLLYIAHFSSVTSNISLRTGSLIVPLHNPLRIFEDLNLVNMLADGRIELFLGSGWNKEDFDIRPEAFEDRRDVLTEFIQSYRSSEGKSSNGKEIFPKLINSVPNISLTISSNKMAWKYAAKLGVNVFTHMENVDHEELESLIREYKQLHIELHGTPGKVTLMQHAAITDDSADPEKYLFEYLVSAMKLEIRSVKANGEMSGNKTVRDSGFLIENGVELINEKIRFYMERGSLICSRNEARRRLSILSDIGVDEVSCLIDFHDCYSTRMQTIKNMSWLQNLENPHSESIEEFLGV